MTTKAVKSQGAQLWFINNAGTPALEAIGQVTQATGLGGTTNNIDITNFDSVAKEYLVGLQDPGTLSFDIVFDPTNTSHQDLITVAQAGTRNQFILLLSDGVAAPTLTGGNIVPPVGRTSAYFLASVHQLQADVQKENVAMLKVQLKLSGTITWTYA